MTAIGGAGMVCAKCGMTGMTQATIVNGLVVCDWCKPGKRGGRMKTNTEDEATNVIKTAAVTIKLLREENEHLRKIFMAALVEQGSFCCHAFETDEEFAEYYFTRALEGEVGSRGPLE